MKIYDQTLPVEALFPLELCCIYKATNTLDNDKPYVGYTIQKLEDRIDQHIIKANIKETKKYRKPYFAKTINKYGSENFRWEIMGPIALTPSRFSIP